MLTFLGPSSTLSAVPALDRASVLRREAPTDILACAPADQDMPNAVAIQGLKDVVDVHADFFPYH
jgi:hypothetical protein